MRWEPIAPSRFVTASSIARRSLSKRHRAASRLSPRYVMRWETSFRRDWNAARAAFRFVTVGAAFALPSVVLIVDIDCTMGACYWHDL